MNKLPRFQFFYKTRSLLKSLVQLPTANMSHEDKLNHFLSQMRELFQRKNSYLVSSYRMGLYFTLKSLNLKPGDEVLLSPITVADTINAIRLSGLAPVLVDMDLDTHSIDLKDLQRKITDRSKVLLVTYLSGIVPNIEDIQSIAKKHQLYFIEDISQNMDANYKQKKIGSHGDVSIASLSCGKNISTLYGGLILSDDRNLMEKISSESLKLKLNGQKSVLFYYLLNCIKVQIATSKFIFPFLVYPLLKLLSFAKNEQPVDFDHDPQIKQNVFRSHNPILRTSFPNEFYVSVNNWQIDLVEHQVKKLSHGTHRRQQLAKSLLAELSPNALKFVPRALHQTKENSYYHFPIYCGNQKSKLRHYLFKNGIDNGSYGLNLCSEESVFDLKSNLPNARIIKHDSLFLPIHEDLSISQMKHIARTVNRYFDTLDT